MASRPQLEEKGPFFFPAPAHFGEFFSPPNFPKLRLKIFPPQRCSQRRNFDVKKIRKKIPNYGRVKKINQWTEKATSQVLQLKLEAQ